ncbi:MAG: response regulator [Planctomycetes bacterium]|nr:response regulator [Planctomycetota bacterium]
MSMEQPINILIVDDEPKNLTVLETVLSDPGYRLVRAESADQALLALVVEEFALLILDIRMPGMTGFELAQMIKERKKTAQVPIIFLTAYYNEDQHVLTGYSTGAVDYLHKPVNPVILRSKVAVFAELHRKQRECAMANRTLLTEVAERRRAEEQLRVLNETLEQRVAERTEALRVADRRKDEFLAVLGHELRNPLSAIVNAVQLIQMVGSDPGTSEWAHSIIKRQSGHLSRIVDDLLDVARITRGKIELRKQPMDLLQIMGRAADTVRSLLAEKNHDFKITIPDSGPLLAEVDPTRLEQCVVNLLRNSAKFTPAGGCIGIAAQVHDAEAVISVRDNGIGIAPEVLPHIFELFTQASGSLDRAEGGLGIGLNICHQLIALHGGSISAFSDGLGQGAEFVIRLPMLREGELNGASRMTPPAREAAWPETPPRRVLVVDDNRDSAHLLSRLLSQHGHKVEIAFDGPAALEAAHEFEPDVFLLDLGLPGIDGYELARHLRANGFGTALLIAISGYAQQHDMECSRAAGFDHHFAKPVEFTKLLSAISLETAGRAR